MSEKRRREVPRGGLPIWRGTKALSALGVVAAMVIAVNVNLLVARFYTRWDVTSEGLYTLSPATTSILEALDGPVKVTVLLARTDPLLAPVRQTLVAYAAKTRKLEIQYLDPEQNPAQFVAVQKKHGIMAGQAEDGRVVTDAVILIARGDRTWFVTNDELSSFDDEGRAKPRIEQALSEGIANVNAAADRAAGPSSFCRAVAMRHSSRKSRSARQRHGRDARSCPALTANRKRGHPKSGIS